MAAADEIRLGKSSTFDFPDAYLIRYVLSRTVLLLFRLCVSANLLGLPTLIGLVTLFKHFIDNLRQPRVGIEDSEMASVQLMQLDVRHPLFQIE